jgi:hypothetical protein
MHKGMLIIHIFVDKSQVYNDKEPDVKVFLFPSEKIFSDIYRSKTINTYVFSLLKGGIMPSGF